MTATVSPELFLNLCQWILYLSTFSVCLYEPLYSYTGPTWSGFQKRVLLGYHYVWSFLWKWSITVGAVVLLRVVFLGVPSPEALWSALFKLWRFYSAGSVWFVWVHEIEATVLLLSCKMPENTSLGQLVVWNNISTHTIRKWKWAECLHDVILHDLLVLLILFLIATTNTWEVMSAMLS